MSLGTAFFEREQALNKKLAWGEWSGYFSAPVYADFHDIEYNAIREAAGVIDITPLYKYEVSGPDAVRLLDRVMTRDMTKLRIDRIFYSPWCDEEGKVLDDGTITRLAEDRFRITAADPCYRWFVLNATGLDVEVADVSDATAALALQGRLSREVLQDATGQDWTDLKYFGRRGTEIAGVTVDVTRTGYTGDRGYELWMAKDDAVAVWDRIFEVGAALRHPPRGHPCDGRRARRGRADPDRGRVHQRPTRDGARAAILAVRARLRRDGRLRQGERFQRPARAAGRAEGRRSRASARGAAPGLVRHRGDVREARPRARDQPLRAPRPDPGLQGGQAGGSHHLHHLGPHDQEDGLRSGRSTRDTAPWARA